MAEIVPNEPGAEERLSTIDSLDPGAGAKLLADLILSRRIRSLPPNSLESLFSTTLQRCAPELESISLNLSSVSAGDSTSQPGPSTSPRPKVSPQELEKYLVDNPTQRELLSNCSILYDANKALDTYRSTWPASFHQEEAAPGPSAAAGPPGEVEKTDGDETAAEDIVEVDDPWADGADESVIDDPWAEDTSPPSPPAPATNEGGALEKIEGKADDPDPPPISLADFIAQPTQLSAIDLASLGALRPIKAIMQRHPNVWDWRYAILDALPSWTSPHDLQENGLLPSIGKEGAESRPPAPSLEDDEPYAALLDTLPPPSTSQLPPPLPRPLSAEEVEQWYRDKISSLDLLAGVDIQLAWVQHAASMGVTGLDIIGEDLSLLSRLVYDSHLSVEDQANWTLSSWQSADPGDIVTAYLSHSTSTSVVSDIKRLVLPYLYVLESRAERAGEADKGLVNRRLYDAILGLPLATALAVFEASKATLSKNERIVKDDMAVARLALACLYGSDERNAWRTMSSIFECLPVWELSGTDPEDDRELTSTTLDSIATFVRPTVKQPKPPKAKDLFIFFQPLPFASLSRALDILDVHLESGEALARWDVPVQLRFLLQSARDVAEQSELAEKMVRRAVAGSNGGVQVHEGRGGPEKTEEMRWNRLWDDMVKLNGAGDTLLRGAFGMMPAEDIMRVYLGGILRSGKLEVAKKMVHRLQEEHGLSDAALEDVVLSVSKELYENAETGNIHSGDMKLAYECLTVAPSSKSIQDERSFIEATSRLTTFALPSSRGGYLTPVEIRHTKDKLDLITLVLKTSKDSYRHDELLLDLARKLGCGSKEDEGLVLAELASAAGQAEDWGAELAYCRRLVDVYRAVSRRGHRRGESSSRKSLDAAPNAEQSVERLRHTTWKTCFELGKQVDFSDIPSKMTLLSWSLEFCPAAEIPTVLETWRKVEDGSLKLSAAAKRRRVAGGNRKAGSGHARNASIASVGSSGDPEKRVLGSRTAARAAKLAMDFGERWRFGGVASPILGSDHGTASPRGSFSGAERPGSAASWRSDEGRRSLDGDRPTGLNVALEDAERVRQGVRRGIVKGVGWLLGAEEGEL